ncbi:MAG: hypothetical protein ACXWMG_01650 [Candidatus Limnocylindria bacterium]
MKAIPLAVRLTLAIGILGAVPMAYAAATPPPVGGNTAGPIAVLAGTGVTDTAAITLAADMGKPEPGTVSGLSGTATGGNREADVVERPVTTNSVLPADRATTSWPLFAVMVGIALVLIVVSLIDTLAVEGRVSAQAGW